MAGKIFISYRRGDDPGSTGRLFDHLKVAFSAGRLFMDVDSIKPGLDFARVVDETLAECDVLLAVIGPSWLEDTDEHGCRRLDDPNDPVRVEIETALKRGKRVIPVLVRRASMPRQDELPESLKEFGRHHCFGLTHERFASDASELIRQLEQTISEIEESRAAAKAKRRSAPRQRKARHVGGTVAPQVAPGAGRGARGYQPAQTPEPRGPEEQKPLGTESSLRSLPELWPTAAGRQDLASLAARAAPVLLRDRYRNLFRLASMEVPYIVLMSALQQGVNEYRFGDIGVTLRPLKWLGLPSAFQPMPIPVFDPTEKKCRLESLRWDVRGGRPHPLRLEFSEITYGDYLKSGEHLDDPIPGEEHLTFRDRFAPDLPSIHDFSDSLLTNISGVGVFLITRDNRIVLSRHSDNVHVMGGVLSYSASGTMDWNPTLHPVTEVIRECREETGVILSTNQVRLFSIGIDARRQYFQFSFAADVPHAADEIIRAAVHAPDYSFEFDRLLSVPFDISSIVRLMRNEVWEPAAQASLLTLCAKRFGISTVEQAIDEGFVRDRYRKTMAAEWDRRAARLGDSAVMSDRYPTHDLAEASNDYGAAVLRFLEGDVAGKDVVEFGCGVGRITKRLLASEPPVARLTCVDLSGAMIERNRQTLGSLASRVSYVCAFAQDYYPETRHDVALCSLVLIHNVDDLAFREMVAALKRSADTLFVFEHCDQGAQTSASTRTRTIEELVANFPEYRIERQCQYRLFNDLLIFLKLVKAPQ